MTVSEPFALVALADGGGPENAPGHHRFRTELAPPATLSQVVLDHARGDLAHLARRELLIVAPAGLSVYPTASHPRVAILCN